MAAVAAQPKQITEPKISDVDQELRASLQVAPPSAIVDWINLLAYGDPGCGKTYLCGTAMDEPRTTPMLFLDCEGGVTTLRKRKNLDVVPIRSIDQLVEIYNKLFYSIKSDGTMYYKVVAIDPLNELADLDMRIEMKKAKDANSDKVDIDVPSPREWGKVRNHMRLIIRGFRDLPCHVIFTAHVGQQQDANQPVKYFPGFSGKLKTEVSGFMDIVGYMYNDTSTGVLVRKMQFEGTRRIQAKDRTGALGGSIDDPSIPKIWSIIEGTN